MVFAWLVHLYTASGLVLALVATMAVVEGDLRTAFLALWLQVVVDATDGALARAVRVAERLPWFSGAKLDDLTDFLTYVFVPALAVWRAELVPQAMAVPVASAMLLASGYGFSRLDAKTPDHFFTGFPSYWNVVVLYLALLGWSPMVNAAVLAGFAVLVFVPIRYVYPSRTPVWPMAMNGLGALWAAAMLWMLWQYPAVPARLVTASLAYPAFYLGVSLWLEVERHRVGR